MKDWHAAKFCSSHLDLMFIFYFIKKSWESIMSFSSSSNISKTLQLYYQMEHPFQAFFLFLVIYFYHIDC